MFSLILVGKFCIIFNGIIIILVELIYLLEYFMIFPLKTLLF